MFLNLFNSKSSTGHKLSRKWLRYIKFYNYIMRTATHIQLSYAPQVIQFVPSHQLNKLKNYEQWESFYCQYQTKKDQSVSQIFNRLQAHTFG